MDSPFPVPFDVGTYYCPRFESLQDSPHKLLDIQNRLTAANDSNKPQDPPGNGLVLTPAPDPSTAKNLSEPSNHGVNTVVTPPTAPSAPSSSSDREQGTNVAIVTSSLPENLEYKDLGRDLESIVKNNDIGQ